MPFKKFHSCRVVDPKKFEKDSFRTITSGKMRMIIGRLKGEDTTTVQSYRYPVADWTEKEAREHCKENGGLFEEAAKENNMDKQFTRYSKEVLKTGSYMYGDEEFNVDIDYLHTLVDSTKAAGLNMFIPIDHDKNPEENKGWVSGLSVEGESIIALMDILDPETDKAVRMGTLADASVSIYSDFVDNEGVMHPAVIREISITNEPFITGMTGYERAMSEDGKETKEIRFSASNRIEKETIMSDVLNKVKELFKIDDDTRIKNLSDKNKELTDSNEALTTELIEVKTELDTLKTELATEQETVKEADWTRTWEDAVREFKVLPAKKDEFKADFPECEQLVTVLSKMDPRKDLTNADEETPPEDEAVVEGLTPETVTYLKERGMSVEEIEKYK